MGPLPERLTGWIGAKKPSAEAVTAAFTMVLAAATIVLVVATFLLANSTDRLVKSDEDKRLSDAIRESNRIVFDATTKLLSIPSTRPCVRYSTPLTAELVSEHKFRPSALLESALFKGDPPTDMLKADLGAGNRDAQKCLFGMYNANPALHLDQVEDAAKYEWIRSQIVQYSDLIESLSAAALRVEGEPREIIVKTIGDFTAGAEYQRLFAYEVLSTLSRDFDSQKWLERHRLDYVSIDRLVESQLYVCQLRIKEFNCHDLFFEQVKELMSDAIQRHPDRKAVNAD